MTAQPRAIVVMGVAGSGKTNVALALSRHYGYAFLDADDFHTADAKACMAAGVPSVIAARLAERRDHFMPALLLGSQFTALQLPVSEPDVLMMDAERPLPQLLTGIIGAMDAA